MNYDDQKTKQAIATALATCAGAPDFATAARGLFAAMGYKSEREIDYAGSGAEFVERFASGKHTKAQEDFCKHAKRVYGLFQYTEDELSSMPALLLGEENTEGRERSFYFFAVELKGKTSCRRSEYANWTRVVNAHLSAPTIVLFRCQGKITFSFIGRRAHKLDHTRDVLQAVSMLREIKAEKPHRGHLEILNKLTLENRLEWIDEGEVNFDSLLAAWLDELDAEALNDRFYGDLQRWFALARDKAEFPLSSETEEERKREEGEHIIRLINRVLFIWFLREKGLVAKELFKPNVIGKCIKNGVNAGGDNYYRAVLQNLFFATLNTEISKRRFSRENHADHRNPALYRYNNLISDKETLLEYFEQTPFVNGGLFECLDDFESEGDGGKRVDCFTDNKNHRELLFVPDVLFFDAAEGKAGLFDILHRYKFVVQENTPIEQEVALDPELLGKVYERLLVHVNNRKATGTYYTPRAVVEFMARDAINHCIYAAFTPPPQICTLKNRLRLLLTAKVDYDALPDKDKLSDAEKKTFIKAVGELKLLDPAAGSGAFLMGALAQLAMALMRIDPKNKFLHARERKQAEGFADDQDREDAIKMVDERFSERNTYNNYARKLMLVRDCLCGVDVSTAAVQICRLRFFISLVIEQGTSDDKADNYGIKALPNLDARIIAADTLVKLEQTVFNTDEEVISKKKILRDIRRKFFSAVTRTEKRKRIKEERMVRQELARYLEIKKGSPDDAARIANWDWDNQTQQADWFDPAWMFGVDEGCFDVVIGNPPYVRQEDIESQVDSAPKPGEYKKELLKRFAGKGIEGRSDLYAYFYVRGLELLKEGGIHVFITSNSWLDVRFGAVLQKHLLNNAHVKAIASSETSKEFYTANINTMVSVMQRANFPDNEDVTAFLSYASPIAEQGAVTKVSKARKELKVSNIDLLRPFSNKWGALYLRAPEIFNHFIATYGDKLRPIDRFADIGLGTKTGAVDFFSLDKTCIEMLGIEPQFLIPMLQNTTDVDSLIIDPQVLPKQLLQCHQRLSELKQYNVAKYILSGEAQGLDSRPSCRGRTPWYGINVAKTYIKMSCLIDEAVRFYIGTDQLASANNFYYINANEEDSYKIAAFANSMIMQLMVNALGRATHGGGLLTIQVYEAEKLPILDLDKLDHRKCREVLHKMGPTQGKDELASPCREELDAYIYDCLGVPNEERDQIREATLDLVRKRKERARQRSQ